MANSIITQARLRALLHYDPISGIFVWLANQRGPIKAGDAAVNRSHGYVTIKIDQRRYMAHRLAWLYINGEFPPTELDHIDGNPLNNRIHNLRIGTTSENQQNRRKAQSNNLSSGLLGVSWCKQHKRWKAYIALKGKTRHIGFFKTKEEAHNAYLFSKRHIHPFCEI